MCDSCYTGYPPNGPPEPTFGDKLIGAVILIIIVVLGFYAGHF